MLRLPEEVSLIGRDGVDEMFSLFSAGRSEKVVGILVQRLQPQVTNTPQQAALHHADLRLGHFDAEFTGDEVREAVETVCRKPIRVAVALANSLRATSRHNPGIRRC